MAAGDKKSPYAVDSDPMLGRRNPLQSAPTVETPADKRRKNRESIKEEFNQPDPIGDAVRSFWGKLRGK